MNTVALFTHLACLEHDTGPWHPENADRLRGVLRALEHPDFVPLLREQAPRATEEQLLRVHPPGYVRAMLSVRPPPGGHVHIDADTLMSEGTLEAVLRAAGGAVAAVDAVMEGWAQAAFAATRPPGHDVHHGNGTQDIFETDPELFYVSSHQSPCYPGTGDPSERGVDGNVLNMTLPPGSGGVEFRRVWEREGLPALDAFRPELVIVSAGFDAHRADPLAQLRLDAEDFGWITDRLLDVADAHAGGRLVSVLEGGYDVAALSASVALHVRRLMRQ